MLTYVSPMAEMEGMSEMLSSEMLSSETSAQLNTWNNLGLSGAVLPVRSIYIRNRDGTQVGWNRVKVGRHWSIIGGNRVKTRWYGTIVRDWPKVGWHGTIVWDGVKAGTWITRTTRTIVYCVHCVITVIRHCVLFLLNVFFCATDKQDLWR